METVQTSNKTAKPAKNQDFASKSDLDAIKGSVSQLEGSVMQLVDMLKAKNSTPDEKKVEKEVKEAGPEDYGEQREWDKIAKEILGDVVSWTGIKYLKGGGMSFTVCIKPEFSNASRDYLDRYKVDLRSREVSKEGDSGVTYFCKLIKQNLKLK